LFKGGSRNPLVEVTVNSKEENSEDFCPNYVQEFRHLENGRHNIHTVGLGLVPGDMSHPRSLPQEGKKSDL
jgi:hypothetical protein